MTSNTSRILAATALAVPLLMAHASAQAQWPKQQPITIVAPFAAGGTADTLARNLATALGDKLGQTVIVENKPGAGSMLGTQYVSAAAPNGYTLLMGSTANVLHKYFFRNPLYKLEDLAPISLVVTNPNFLGVNKDLPVNNLNELIAYAKANPGKLTCANAGVGSTPYLSCELFKSLAGVDILNVPYRGGVPAITDVIGGNAHMFIQSEGLRYIQGNQVKGIAVSSEQRSSYLPELPTISEALPGFKAPAWYGVFAPGKLPDDIKKALSQAITEVVQTPKFKQDTSTFAAEPAGGTPEQFAAFIKDQVDYYDVAVPKLGIKAE